MKPDEEVLRQRSCRQAEGRVGKAESAKLSSSGAGGQVKPVQRFGDVRSDRRRLIFFAALRLRRERLSGNAFAGAEARQRRSAAHRERFRAAELSRDVYFSCSRRKFSRE